MRVCTARALRTPIVLLVLLGSVASARADAPEIQQQPAPPEPPPVYTSHWYGPRLLMADVVTLGLAAIGGGTESLPMTSLGLAAWVLTAPIVHAQHAGLPRGAISLALRAGLPALGLLLASSASDGCWRDPGASDTCDVSAMITGVMLGALFAEIIDVAMVAHDRHAVAPPAVAPAHGWTQLLVAPKSNGGLLGIAGAF